MQPDWSSYRITLLLYLGVLILPFSFYYTYCAIDDVESDTAIVQKLNQIGGSMIAYNQTNSVADRIKIGLSIDQNLKSLTPWFFSKDREGVYFREEAVSKSYEGLLSCWDRVQNNHKESQIGGCWKKVKSINYMVNTMLTLKQNKLKNIFYVNLLLAVIFLILMIMLVRNYIHRELSKSSIYDLPTKLYTKEYFSTQIATSHSRAKRYSYPLSVIAIESDELHKDKAYDNKTKEHIHSILGGLIASLTRSSDIACRYDYDRFAIILPDTPDDGTQVLKERIREALGDEHFISYPGLHFKVGSAQFDGHETPEELTARSFDDLA